MAALFLMQFLHGLAVERPILAEILEMERAFISGVATLDLASECDICVLPCFAGAGEHSDLIAQAFYDLFQHLPRMVIIRL